MTTIENNNHSINLDNDQIKILAIGIDNSIGFNFSKCYKKIFAKGNGYLTYDDTQELERYGDKEKYKEVLRFLYSIKYHGSLSKSGCELFQTLLSKRNNQTPILEDFKQLINECIENNEYLRWY